MKTPFLLKNAKKLAERYTGKYIAVTGNKVIASGSSRLETYKKASKKLSAKQTIGIYYLPKPEELFMQQ